MDYKNLGRTGLKVSRFCLGTFNFYHVTPESEALELLDKAESMGINFIDTANIYGKETSYRGAVEDLLGQWFLKKKGRRDAVVLSTKVFGAMGTAPTKTDFAYHIRQAARQPRRLKPITSISTKCTT